MCVCVHVFVCLGGENKDREVEAGGRKKRVQMWEGFCPLYPGGHQVSLKAGPKRLSVLPVSIRTAPVYRCEDMQSKCVFGKYK